MPEATLGGTRTHWRAWGSGERKALMIHCSLAHSGAWAGVAERLSDALQMRAFDLPGHGQSGDWDQARDLSDQTMDMALGLLDGPTDLVGHSFGAVICLRLAVERPDLVRSLTLYEPVFFAAAIAAGYPVDVLFGDFGAALAAGDLETAARAFISLWGAGEAWEDIRPAQRAALVSRIHLIPAGIPLLQEDCAGLLSAGRLEAVAVPVLLIQGERSPPVVDVINRELAARLPGARRIKIAGADHMGPVTHPDDVAAAIRSLL